ncbi:MAG: hypothetical protein N3B21_05690 [Clostridia bacterium]|nr:hypothetical protein [Clostridia bacterium]
MNDKQTTKRLGNIGAYLPRILKFYDLKSERLAQAIFLLIFAIQLAGNFIGVRVMGENPGYTPNNLIKMSAITGGMLLAVNFISSIYLYAYINQLKGRYCSAKECVWAVLKRPFTVVGALVLYGILTTTSFAFFLVVYFMFLFTLCYIVDKKMGVAQAFSASKRLTTGYKMQMFVLVTAFKFLIDMPILLMVMSINNTLAVSFISSFITAIVHLMYQRLVALMYFELEYRDVDTMDQTLM